MDNGSVGYGKPPEHSRFKKGLSGNPKGRPKRKKDLATITDKVLREKVVVTENGRRRSITKLELIIRQLTNKAAQGNMPAVKILQGLLQNHAEMLNAEQGVTRDTPLTLATIDNILSGNVIYLNDPRRNGDDK